MPMDATFQLVGFIGLGITMLGVGVGLAGLLINLMNQQEKRSEARLDRLEKQLVEYRAENNQQLAEVRSEVGQRLAEVRDEVGRQLAEHRTEINQQLAEHQAEVSQRLAEHRAEINQQLAEFRAEVGRQFEQMDGRLRGVEQGQAFLAGEISALKDFFTHQPRRE